ncbi:hypothetical protein FRC14_004189 [Serendipita sp. 396]|nr:hypothetical protein FRC14_004189 [Serendipita sp. 396]
MQISGGLIEQLRLIMVFCTDTRDRTSHLLSDSSISPLTAWTVRRSRRSLWEMTVGGWNDKLRLSACCKSQTHSRQRPRGGGLFHEAVPNQGFLLPKRSMLWQQFFPSSRPAVHKTTVRKDAEIDNR